MCGFDMNSQYVMDIASGCCLSDSSTIRKESLILFTWFFQNLIFLALEWLKLQIKCAISMAPTQSTYKINIILSEKNRTSANYFIPNKMSARTLIMINIS